MIKICEQCEKEFEAKGRAKFCSDACKMKAYRSRQRKEKECLICGKKFKPTHGSQLYCSHKCSRTKEIKQTYIRGKIARIEKQHPTAKISEYYTPMTICIDCGQYTQKIAGTKRCKTCSIIELEIRRGRIYKGWADKIKARDKKCQICGSTHDLEAHHIYPKMQYPEKARDIEYGITLCAKCHRTDEGSIHKILGHIYTPEQWATWYYTRKHTMDTQTTLL